MDHDEVAGRGYLWDWFAARAQGPQALFWLVLVSFFEPIFLPIVPESLMAAMVLARRRDWKQYVLLTAVVSTLGGIAGYLIGVFLFREFGEPLLAAYGLRHWFHAVRVMLSGNVFVVMLLVTFTPIPDKAFVILAGFFHVPFLPYVFGFLLGRLLRFGLIAFLVQRFGERILAPVRRYFEWLALVVVLIFLAAVLYFFHAIP